MNDITIRKGLSATEAKIISDLVSEGKTVFSINELARKTGSGTKARKIAWKLVKKRWLERLGKGIYLVLELGAGSEPKWTEDSYYIASKLAGTYYIGFYNMLHDYGWTEQIPLTINVAAAKKLKNRVLYGVPFNFIFLSKKKFFGTVKKFIRGHEIIVSDPEKTLVDALDHPEYCGGILEVAKALFNANNHVNWNKLVNYAKRLGNGTVFKRLGYLAELMGIHLSKSMIKIIQQNITKGYSPLYPGIKNEGRHNSKWNLVINVKISKEVVLA